MGLPERKEWKADRVKGAERWGLLVQSSGLSSATLWLRPGWHHLRWGAQLPRVPDGGRFCGRSEDGEQQTGGSNVGFHSFCHHLLAVLPCQEHGLLALEQLPRRARLTWPTNETEKGIGSLLGVVAAWHGTGMKCFYKVRNIHFCPKNLSRPAPPSHLSRHCGSSAHTRASTYPMESASQARSSKPRSRTNRSCPVRLPGLFVHRHRTHHSFISNTPILDRISPERRSSILQSDSPASCYCWALGVSRSAFCQLYCARVCGPFQSCLMLINACPIQGSATTAVPFRTPISINASVLPCWPQRARPRHHAGAGSLPCKLASSISCLTTGKEVVNPSGPVTAHVLLPMFPSPNDDAGVTSVRLHHQPLLPDFYPLAVQTKGLLAP